MGLCHRHDPEANGFLAIPRFGRHTPDPLHTYRCRCMPTGERWANARPSCFLGKQPLCLKLQEAKPCLFAHLQGCLAVRTIWGSLEVSFARELLKFPEFGDKRLLGPSLV